MTTLSHEQQQTLAENSLCKNARSEHSNSKWHKLLWLAAVILSLFIQVILLLAEFAAAQLEHSEETSSTVPGNTLTLTPYYSVLYCSSSEWQILRPYHPHFIALQKARVFEAVVRPRGSTSLPKYCRSYTESKR